MITGANKKLIENLEKNQPPLEKDHPWPSLPSTAFSTIQTGYGYIEIDIYKALL